MRLLFRFRQSFLPVCRLTVPISLSVLGSLGSKIGIPMDYRDGLLAWCSLNVFPMSATTKWRFKKRNAHFLLSEMLRSLHEVLGIGVVNKQFTHFRVPLLSDPCLIRAHNGTEQFLKLTSARTS